MHFRGIALEEATAAADKERVAREHSFVGPVLKEIAYAVLRVAGCMKRGYFDVLADGEGGVVGRCRGDLVAVFAANDGEFEVFELVS